MSNKQAQLSAINLAGSVCLNKVKTDIEQYDSSIFNHKDSLTFGGVLSNWHRYYVSDCIKMYKGSRIWKKDKQIVLGDKPIYYVSEDRKFVNTKLTDYNPLEKELLVSSINIDGNLIIDGHVVGAIKNYKEYYTSVKQVAQNDYIISLIQYGHSSMVGADATAMFSYYYDKLQGTIVIKNQMYYDDRIGCGFLYKDGKIYMLTNDIVDSFDTWVDNAVEIGNNLTACNVAPYDYYTELSFMSNNKWYFTIVTKDGFMFTEPSDSLLLSRVDNVPTWLGGFKFALGNGWHVLYNNGGVIEGISYNNNIVVREVDKIMEVDSDSVIYMNKGNYYKVSTTEGVDISVVGDFLILNTTAYLNTVDLRTGRAFSRSDDYNNRLIPYTAVAWDTQQKDNEYYFQYATGYNETFFADAIPNFATLNAPLQLVAFTTDINEINKYLRVHDYWGDTNRISIDLFSAKSDGGLPYYRYSIGDFDRDLRSSLEIDVTEFPITASADVLYNLTVLDEIKDTYLNRFVIKSLDFSSPSHINTNQDPVLGYYASNKIDFDNLILVQGVYYAISDRYIMYCNLDENSGMGVSVVANKSDLKYIGSTTRMALFYSQFDQAIYSFTGDQNLTKYVEASSIHTVGTCYNNPAIGLIAVETNEGTIVYYGDEMCVMDETSDNLYFDDNSLIIGNWRYCLDSRAGWDCLPIEIESKYFGDGSNMKSVNDTVYIRLFNDHELDKLGKVEVSCGTLNECSKESNTKIFNIDKSVWDKDTHTFMLRYQPQLQASAGFKIRIKSDFCIADIYIGHSVETVQNSKFNI